MKNIFLRLCGGFSVMIRPDSDMGLDLRTLDCFDDVSKKNAIMLKFPWEGIEVTMYRDGSLIFYHFEDQEIAEKYAGEIWERIGS